jgi:hypothetical protein
LPSSSVALAVTVFVCVTSHVVILPTNEQLQLPLGGIVPLIAQLPGLPQSVCDDCKEDIPVNPTGVP